MARHWMIGIEATSETGATQGVGYDITFKPNTSDAGQGFSSPEFKEWRQQVNDIVLQHRDNVFDAVKGDDNARQLAAEIIAVSKAKGIMISDDGDVPAIQISGIDSQDGNKGTKKDIRVTEGQDLPESVVTTRYRSRLNQAVGGDGSGGIGLSAARSYEFQGQVIANSR